MILRSIIKRIIAKNIFIKIKNNLTCLYSCYNLEDTDSVGIYKFVLR